MQIIIMNENICGAKTRQGTSCQRSPARGRKRCRLHGGATPRGRASPHFKTGEHSKFLPDRLIGRYEEAQADPHLRSLRQDIAILQVRIQELCQQLKHGSPESKPIWEMIAKAIMLKARVLRQESKLLAGKRQMIPSEEVIVLLAAIFDVIHRHVSDRKTKAAIYEELRQLLEKDSMTEGTWRN